MPARCCGGSRTQGGIYLICGVGAGGRPLEDFLLDPPIPVPEDLVVPKQGLGTFQREETCSWCKGIPGLPECPNCDGKGKEMVTHVVDHIGSIHYPNVVDDIEEVRAIGSSRRIPSSFPFHLLSARSRHFRCHDRALIENWEEYNAHWNCPKHIEGHRAGLDPKPDPMCLGMLWEDYTPEQNSQEEPRNQYRDLPCGRRFLANSRPVGVTPIYRRAFYMSLPITRIEVVQGSDHYEKSLKAAQKASLEVLEVEE